MGLLWVAAMVWLLFGGPAWLTIATLVVLGGGAIWVGVRA